MNTNPRRWAAIVALAALLVLPRGILAQIPASSWHDVDTGKLQPLDLQPGCWAVRTHISSSGMSGHIPPEQRAAIEKAPNMTPEQRAQYISQFEAAAQQAKQTFEKGTVSTSLFCVPAPFLDASKDIYGTPAAQCTRMAEPSGQELHARVTCPTRTSDYQRIDSRNFKSTTRTIVNPQDQGAGRDIITATTTIVGKWTGDLTPHMPYAPSVTDLDGVRPKGPVAVAGLDPNRIVASIDGTQLTAFRALGLIRSDEIEWQYPADHDAILNNEIIEGDGQKLNVLTDLQWIYMHFLVAQEAIQLHLYRLDPWKHQLLQLNLMEDDINDPQGERADRDQILWAAYFDSQAKTPAEKQALFEREKQKYKVTVIDPDFFFGRSSQ